MDVNFLLLELLNKNSLRNSQVKIFQNLLGFEFMEEFKR